MQTNLNFEEVQLGAQCEDILVFLRDGGTLTSLEAIRAGIGRLAARIHDLKKAGYNIEREMIPVTKANGTVTRVARYRMRE